MVAVMANSMLNVPVAWALSPEGVGCMAYHQRYQGITLAQVLSVAESEDELWAIADGWCEAAGCDAYTDEMIEELSEVKVLPADMREDWVGV